MRMAGFRWAYLLAAAAAFVATFPLVTGEGTWRRVVSAVGAATIAFLGVYGLAVLWGYLAYRRSGYRNPYWECACQAVTNTASVVLRWGLLTQDIGVLGLPTCMLTRPDGKTERLVIGIDRGASQYDSLGQHSVLANFQLSGDGDYKVRWYADPMGTGKPAELCRATFVVSDGKLQGAGPDFWALG